MDEKHKEISDHWHKILVQAIRKNTGCSHEEAFAALGEVCEAVQKIHIDAYSRGYLSGFNDCEKRALRDKSNKGESSWLKDQKKLLKSSQTN